LLSNAKGRCEYGFETDFCIIPVPPITECRFSTADFPLQATGLPLQHPLLLFWDFRTIDSVLRDIVFLRVEAAALNFDQFQPAISID
jgi:hypothetical protein